MNDFGDATGQSIAPESNLKTGDVARRIARHVNNTEVTKPVGTDESLADLFSQGLKARVTEIDLFNAFQELDSRVGAKKGKKRHQPKKRKQDCDSVGDDGPKLQLSRFQPGQVSSQGGYTLLFHKSYYSQPPLLSCLPSQGFGLWLAGRKKEWKQQQQRKFDQKGSMVVETISLSNHRQSVEVS